MKIVIDIPEDVRNKIIEIYNSSEELHTRGNLYQAIANGKPCEERPQGEWIDICTLPAMVKCSHCGTVFGMAENISLNFNFCPNCGADMRGEE